MDEEIVRAATIDNINEFYNNGHYKMDFGSVKEKLQQRFKLEGLVHFFLCSEFESNGEIKYRSIIHDKNGGIWGYDFLFDIEELGERVKIYTSRYKAPYGVLTSPDCYEETTKLFKDLGYKIEQIEKNIPV